jgi:ABC-2 type transport system permease protein
MVVFSFGMLIYISVLMYGQIVLGAVIEEKETRIAEILFSSMRSFPLMIGKLVGVSLVALTQLTIWGLALLAFAVFGAGMMGGGSSANLPHVPPIMFVYFVLYFLLGYFIYATVYALIGSMVTTTQEGGQLAMPVVLMLVAGFYFVFPIIRSPNSSLAFWASMFPFLAPITMMVRITTETPPAWQIILSLAIGFATVIGLIWLASRSYRVGMLMYGKKATIPEVLRWIRQA